MKVKIKYKQNPHQKEFKEDLKSKFLHLSGGMGSGKSHALCMKALELSFINNPWPGGLMAPSLKDVKRDIVPLFETILEGSGLNYIYHKSEYYYQFPWSPGKLYLFSAENQLRGPNLAYFLFNEVTLMDPVRYREGIARVRIRGARAPQIASVGTPEGTDNFIYEMFVEKPLPNSRIIYGDVRDNAMNLSPGYIEALTQSFDTKMRDAYISGLWVNMKNGRFYYAYDPEKNHDKTLKRKEFTTVHCFMDFNVQYMTCTLWHFDGMLIGFDEIVLEDNADTYKMCDALKARGYLPESTIIYPDPASKQRSTKGMPDIEILRKCGFQQIRVRTTQPRFRQRQLNTNNLLDKGMVKFNPDTMPTFKKDLSSVVQDPVTLEKDKKNPKLTHASDGFDYGCDILFEFSGRKPESTVTKFR